MIKRARRILNAKPWITGPLLMCILMAQAWAWWWPAGKTEDLPVIIPITVVQIRGHQPMMCLSLKSGVSAVQKASTYWEQYGIKLKVTGVGVIRNCEMASIACDCAGEGELAPIIDEIEKRTGTMVVVLPERFLELDGTRAPSVAGLASANRNGFALASSDWRVAAHEMAHVLCGCYHTYFFQPGNILNSGISDTNAKKEDIRLTAWQAYWARQYACELDTKYRRMQKESSDVTTGYKSRLTLIDGACR